MSLPLPSRPARLAYLGTPELAVPTLQALVTAGYDIALVVTRADARRGRGSQTAPSPVKAAAQALGLPVSHDIDDVLAVGAELGVVVAYGRLIRANVLQALPLVNLHFSLLPRWRGAAPVERALLAGDERTGVCLMDVVDELDAGDVFGSTATPIGPDDTLESLRARLVEAGTELLLEGLANGFDEPRPQVGEVTYASKLTVADRELDLAASAAVARRVIAVGGAWTTHAGRRFKVWEASPLPLGEEPAEPGATGELRSLPGSGGPILRVGDGWLVLRQVQPEGKPRLDGRAWWNGLRPAAIERLGS